MDIKSLYNIYITMNSSESDGQSYSVVSILESHHKIGKSTEGYPKVFVSTHTTSTSIHNLNGELFSVEYNVMCSLLDDTGEKMDEVYSIITLRSTKDDLVKIFFEVFGMAMEMMPDCPDDEDLEVKIEGLLAIFSAIKRKPIKKIQGLWAELLVILTSKHPDIVAKAWHNSPGSKYDFTMGTHKIEVKSTSSEDRIHKFSLDQLNPTQSAILLIASVIVRESAQDANGLSVYDLYDRICKIITDVDLRMHIYTVITNTLGEDYDNARNVYFDYASGSDSLAFYEYQDIPKIDKASVPQLVTTVKFSSELSHLQSIRDKNLSFEPNSLLGSL